MVFIEEVDRGSLLYNILASFFYVSLNFDLISNLWKCYQNNKRNSYIPWSRYIIPFVNCPPPFLPFFSLFSFPLPLSVYICVYVHVSLYGWMFLLFLDRLLVLKCHVGSFFVYLFENLMNCICIILSIFYSTSYSLSLYNAILVQMKYYFMDLIYIYLH